MPEKKHTIPQLVEKARLGKLSRRQLIKALSAMGISTVGSGTIVAAALNSSASKLSPVVHTDTNASTHLQLHDHHLAHQAQGNLGALNKDYAEHAVVEDSMYSAPIVGRAAIIARKSLGLVAVSDAQITVINRIAIGNQLTVEWIAAGIHSGDLPGLPATYRTYTLRGVTVVIREKGKIVREALYYDVADLYRQLSQ